MRLSAGDEYRCIARDLVDMGQHDMARQAWKVGRQVDREQAASAFMQGIAAMHAPLHPPASPAGADGGEGA